MSQQLEPSLRPWRLGAAGTLVIAVALLAVVVPARRAANMDPAVVLRDP